jgi:hypothetical protein
MTNLRAKFHEFMMHKKSASEEGESGWAQLDDNPGGGNGGVDGRWVGARRRRQLGSCLASAEARRGESGDDS